MKLGKRSVDHVVDVKGVSELDFASIKENGHIRIGANVTLSELLKKDLFPPSMALLKMLF
jgi:CO/xanthine dehydrogenase FAD-binding subunit